MYTAEHLDLITNVSDNFTEPLTRLSGLLETVGQQAEELNPIYIRTVVEDRQLRQLNRRLATGQTLDIGTTVSGATTPSGGDVDGGGISMSRMANLFGLPTQQLTSGQQFDPAAMAAGDNPFTSGGDHLSDILSPRAFSRAIDSGKLFRQMGPQAPADIFGGPDAFNALSRLSSSQLMGLFETDSMEGVYEAIGESVDKNALQMEQLKESLFNARIGMTQFYDIVAAGLPLMLTFVGSIPAVIGALGGLAAAALGAAGGLAGILGLGLAGAARSEAGGGIPSAEDFTALFDGVGEAFFESFDPLLTEFEPLVRDAIGGLPGVFDQLADASTVLVSLKDDARAFGTFVVDFTSGAIRELGTLANAARPVFGMIAEGLSNLNITQRLGGALRETLPQLAQLTSLFLDALPVIFNISRGLLFVSTAITQFVGGIVGGIRAFFGLFGVADQVDTMFGVLIGSTLVLGSALFLTTNIMSMMNSSFVTLLTNMGAAKFAGDGLVSTLGNIALGMKGVTLSSLSAASAINAAKLALKTFMISTVVGGGLVALTSAVSYLAQEWGVLGDEIDGVTDSMRENMRQRNRMGSRRSSFVGELGGNVYVDITETQNMTFEGDASARDADYAGFVNSSNATDTLQ